MRGPVVIGAGAVIGGNVWLTQSVPPGSHVRQAHPTLAIISPAGNPVESAEEAPVW